MKKVKKMAMGGMGVVKPGMVKPGMVKPGMVKPGQAMPAMPPRGMPAMPPRAPAPPPRAPAPPPRAPAPPPRPVAPTVPKGVAPKAPTPIQGISKNDPFYKSPEYKSFQNNPANRMATMDMYDSPYFGSVGSGSIGRAQDAAYRKYKGIAEPAPNSYGSSPAQPVGRGSTMAGALGMVGGNPTGFGLAGAKADFQSPGGMQAKFGPPSVAPGAPQAMGGIGMKKGGMVSSKPKASSASSRGDGIATKGKTKGRFV